MRPHTYVVSDSNLGPIELRVGTLWSGNRMLIDYTLNRVWYTIDDRLYEWWTSAFIREEYINAMSLGAHRARHMVTLAHIEMALLTGILVPWYIMLGIGFAKLGFFYLQNKGAVETAMEKGPDVVRSLLDLKRRSPVLLDKMLGTLLREVLRDLPSGVTGEDIAFFVGRVIKGAKEAPSLTFALLLKIISKVLVIVAATHLPSIIGHGTEKAAMRLAEDLQRELAGAGIHVTRTEAKNILVDLLSKEDSKAKLRELETATKALLPALDALQRAYTRM